MKAVTNSCLILSVQLESANHQAIIDFSYLLQLQQEGHIQRGKDREEKGEKVETVSDMEVCKKLARFWRGIC